PAPTPRKKNIVTSFGNPVSDVWYVMWDSVNIHFPQMFVGRIPANNDAQVLLYLQKHQKYLQQKYDLFNKSFIFFSGGDATKPSELTQIIAANEFVMNNYVKASPLFGNANHFYKTITPPSNFGPYSLDYVQRVIDEGGLFISYIGHSGTRTWDNSISEVEHIKNKYNDRFPLISDFGCSTGKFAEPDVDAFGELFVCQSPNGQAIAYLGNSSWGYLSTSLRFPRLFYEILVRDSLKGIGRAHTLAKIRQLNETGTGDVNRVFTYCNLLFGDPIIGLKFPDKPNFVVNNSNIKLLTEQPNDQLDSVRFRVVISNFGIVNGDSIKIGFLDIFNDSTLQTKVVNLPFIKFQDTIQVTFPVGKHIGNRTFKVIIDPENLVQEIYEDDNSAKFDYVINSTSLTTLELSELNNTQKEEIEVLNPFVKRKSSLERFILELSTSKDFNQSRTFLQTFDTLITKVALTNLIPNQRYYYRLRLDEPDAFWSKTRSFIQGKSNLSVLYDSSIVSNEFFEYYQASFDTNSKAWKLDLKKQSLKIISGGGHDGAFGSIQWNGYEQLPNTYYWGLATAIIDSITLQPTTIRYFNVPDPGVSDSLTNYVNRLQVGTLIAMTISADAAQNVLGWSGGTPPRNAIKTLGSLYIDSIRYREGWCILGKKGAPIGSVPEDYKKLFAGVAQIEISKNVNFDSGYVVFPEFRLASQWNFVKIESERPSQSNIIFIPLGIRANGQVDTLYQYQTNQDSINLQSLNAKIYPSLKILAKFYANPLKESPKIYSIGANYVAVPELAVNYQTISTNKDTIMQGEQINYLAKIYNVGKSTADTFRVLLELIRNDNTSYVLIDTVITQLNTNSYITLNYSYINKVYDGFGNFAFKLTIDPDNSIQEFVEQNNIFLKSFYVKKDTTTSVSAAAVSVLFNGREIRDWEFVEPDARIEVKINYPIWFPVTDTSAVQIYLDGQRYYANQVNFDYDTIERKINVTLETKLSKGEHNLRVYLKDAFGRISNQPIIDKYFKVTADLELRNVFNYPNPFNNGTHFTFVLTQIPDEIQIKVYTISGRLIKEMKLSAAELTTNFNKVFWDGRDEDGDLVGNGVYLYKIIARKGDKVQTTIQKLAVVR
ncbi:MAG: C25 family cysteine peptidase, partial [Ignavibacteria bacterium]|nr:C25 family cysteine peptidase [Ignavibacteria bacterium]